MRVYNLIDITKFGIIQIVLFPEAGWTVNVANPSGQSCVKECLLPTD
ncbi:MAG: hypothetical protein ABEI32_07745 [Halothece sp.]